MENMTLNSKQLQVSLGFQKKEYKKILLKIITVQTVNSCLVCKRSCSASGNLKHLTFAYNIQVNEKFLKLESGI